MVKSFALLMTRLGAIARDKGKHFIVIEPRRSRQGWALHFARAKGMQVAALSLRISTLLCSCLLGHFTKLVHILAQNPGMSLINVKVKSSLKKSQN